MRLTWNTRCDGGVETRVEDVPVVIRRGGAGFVIDTDRNFRIHGSTARRARDLQDRVERFVREERVTPYAASSLPLEAQAARLRYEGVFTPVRRFVEELSTAGAVDALSPEQRAAVDRIVRVMRGEGAIEGTPAPVPSQVLGVARRGYLYFARWP